MRLLPTDLSALSDVTGDNTRFSTAAVHLVLHGDNTYVAEATDTKVAVRVAGPCVANPDDYPDIPALAAAPNGKAEGLIPAAVWKKTFAAAAKHTRRGHRAELKSVATKVGAELATFGYTDLDSSPVESTRMVEGRFPPLGDIIPPPMTGRDLVAVDADRLADVLKAMAKLAPHGGNFPVVHLETYGSGKPLRLVANGEDGRTVTAIVMPIQSDEADKFSELVKHRHPAWVAAESERDELRQRVRELEREAKGEHKPESVELVELAEKLDEATRNAQAADSRAEQWKASAGQLEEVVAAREDRIRELVAEAEATAVRMAHLEREVTALRQGAEPPAGPTGADLVRDELDATRAERDTLADRVGQLEHLVRDQQRTIDTVQHNGRELAADRDRLQAENARLAQLAADRFRDSCVMANAVESSALAVDRGESPRPLTRRERLALANAGK